jgi:hypothetical protein
MANQSKALQKSKVTFGQRKTGKAKKRFGPKEAEPKKYRGQGK